MPWGRVWDPPWKPPGTPPPPLRPLAPLSGVGASWTRGPETPFLSWGQPERRAQAFMGLRGFGYARHMRGMNRPCAGLKPENPEP